MKIILRILLVPVLILWALLIVFPPFDLLLVYASELWTPVYIAGALGISFFFLAAFIFTIRKSDRWSKYI